MILHAASLRGRTWFLFFFLVILSFDLFGGGKGAATEQIEVIAGEWDEVNDVRKLYDTPVGAVYEFGLSLSWNCTPYFESGTWQIGAREHEKNCKCDICRKMRSGIKGVLLASLGKRALKRKRFVVLDFKIRAFPAIASNQTSSFQFQIVRSGETKIKSNYGDVTGILFSGSSLLRSFSTEFIQPPNFWIIRTEGFPYRPDFGLYSCRIIFNTYTGNNLTVIRNGYHVIFLQPEAPAPRLPIEINSLGIISQDRGGNKGNRREYLEISSPVIYRFNSEALLQELPAQDVVAYPYDAYLLKDSKDRPVPAGQEWRKVKGSKNPDLQYAYALRWLYGDECNPSRAIDLLEEAAKEKHALADYELGVCYYRGYGVTPNEKKADRYLKEAETFGYSKAAVLRSMIFWEQHNRPKFYDRKSWNDSMVEMIEASGKSIEHDRESPLVVGGIEAVTIRRRIEAKPVAVSPVPVGNFPGRNLRGVRQELEQHLLPILLDIGVVGFQQGNQLFQRLRHAAPGGGFKQPAALLGFGCRQIFLPLPQLSVFFLSCSRIKTFERLVEDRLEEWFRIA